MCSFDSAMPSSEEAATARLLVTGVILFDELVEALTECVSVLTEPGMMDVDEWKAWQKQTITKARALLKRAKEES